MKAFCQHSFILVLHAVFLLIAYPVIARPITTFHHNHLLPRQASKSTTAANSVPSDVDGVQTIETEQTFTMFGGNTTEICTLIRIPTTLANGDAAIIFTKNCSVSFTPASSPASTTGTVPPTTSSTTLLTTIVTNKAPATTMSLSMFMTDAPPAPTPTISSSHTNPTTSVIPAATARDNSSSSLSATTNGAPANIVGASVSASTDSIVSSASPTAAASTSSTDPFTSTAQSHLSSLPIFLGAFGGIAGVALLVVGFKVYRPLQRFDDMRLNPPGFVRRFRSTNGGKKWWHVGEHDDEKITGRSSQERGSSETEPPTSGWIS